jgi:hypothetical protein
MFFIIEILHNNIPSPKTKKKSQFFFQKLTEFMKKKHCLLVCIWIAQLKGRGGDVHGFGVTPMQEFFLNFATPSTLCPNGQPQILSPHKPFFHFVCPGSFWFG